MSITSKSPRKVALVAWAVAKDVLPAYSHRCSPKRFTQPQLFVCLVLKAFYKTDYRGIAEILADSPELCASIELIKVPHYTTIQKASVRLLKKQDLQNLLTGTVHKAIRQKILRKRVHRAAIDGTGFESHHVSSYFVKRREKCGKHWQKTTYTRFPKAGILADCGSHVIICVVPGRGPGPDITHWRTALYDSLGRVRIEMLLADAGYDSEDSHVFARKTLGCRTLIPPLIGRRTSKPPSGYWRRRMSQRFDKASYGQRWQGETVNSMIKRRLGSALGATSYWSQFREMFLRAIVHNVMILWRHLRGFLQSRSEAIYSMSIHPVALMASDRRSVLSPPESRHPCRGLWVGGARVPGARSPVGELHPGLQKTPLPRLTARRSDRDDSAAAVRARRIGRGGLRRIGRGDLSVTIHSWRPTPIQPRQRRLL